MKVLIGSAVALAALVVGASPAATHAGADVLVFFRTPSGNIGCAYAHFAGEPASLRCDIGSGLVPLPPRPKGCAWTGGSATP